MEKPKSVEACVESLPEEQRSPLQKLRETIAAAAPEAEEGITYSVPGFRLGGHGFVAYAAFKDHYSFFPMSSEAVERHRDELGSRVTGNLMADQEERLTERLMVQLSPRDIL